MNGDTCCSKSEGWLGWRFGEKPGDYQEAEKLTAVKGCLEEKAMSFLAKIAKFESDFESKMAKSDEFVHGQLVDPSTPSTTLAIVVFYILF